MTTSTIVCIIAVLHFTVSRDVQYICMQSNKNAFKSKMNMLLITGAVVVVYWQRRGLTIENTSLGSSSR